MACTIGAKILRSGEEYVLFKNKDLPRDTFDDHLVAEDEVFGVLGIHIPAGGLGPRDVLSGFSIGANADGVSACNSHVRSIEDGENYDTLTEAAVRGTRTAREACEKVVALAPLYPYNWSNILIADPHEVAIVEVAGDVAHVHDRGAIARANRHLLQHADGQRPEPCARAARASALLDAATDPDHVIQLCRSHEGQTDNSNICAHGPGRQGNTVYSYVLHWREGQMTLLVRRGPPCAGEYACIPLTFPLDLHELAPCYPTSWSPSD